MIYFDTRPLLELLSEIQCGRLFVDILEYADEGIEPDFGNDIGLAIAWTQIKPKIDRDEERYHESVLQHRYASYCKTEKAHQREPCSFDEWKEARIERLTKEPTVNGRYPTTATTSSATPTSAATPTISITTSSNTSAVSLGKGECERKNLLHDEEPYGAYKPPSEDEFEKMRQQKLEILSRGTGKPLQ